MKGRKNYAIVFGVVFLFLVLSMSFTSAVTSPQDSNQNVFQVVSHWFSDLGSKFTGKVIDAPSATGNVIAGAPNLQQCVDCAAPPFGCSYSGGSCTTCGTLVDSATGGPCTGGDIGIVQDNSSEYSCTDSDGGMNYFVKGYTNYSYSPNIFGEIHEDYCANTSNSGDITSNISFGNSIAEQYCSAQNSSGTLITVCPQGSLCLDGACIQSNSSGKFALGFSQGISVNFNEKNYSFFADSINDGSAVLEIGFGGQEGKDTLKVSQGNSFVLRDGTILYVNDIFYQALVKGIGQVVFTLSPATKTLPSFDVILNNPTLFPSLGLSTKPEHTIVEFADFQDPYSGLASGIPNWTLQYKENYQDLFELSKKIRLAVVHRGFKFIYAPMDFLGKDSTYAAQAALCANEQDKFWEMHDAILTIQSQNPGNGNYGKDKLEGIAQGISGLDQAKFKTCLENDETLSDVQKAAEISSNFASGSPTFYIDGKQVPGSWKLISNLIGSEDSNKTSSYCTWATDNLAECTLYVENTPFGNDLLVKEITKEDATLRVQNKTSVTLKKGESYSFLSKKKGSSVKYTITLKDLFYSPQRDARLVSSNSAITGQMTILADNGGNGGSGSGGAGFNMDEFWQSGGKINGVSTHASSASPSSGNESDVNIIYGDSVSGSEGEVIKGDSYIKLEISKKDGSNIKAEATKGIENIPIDVSSQSECTSGCYSDGTCYPIGYRVNGTFCSSDKNFTTQLSSNLACQNSFECSSNVCANNQCVSEGLIQKILNWFSRLFGGSSA